MNQEDKRNRREIFKTLEEAHINWIEIPLGRGEDLSKRKFKKLQPLYRTADTRTAWVCKCDCGNYIKIRGDHLREKDRDNSCGYCDGEKMFKACPCIYKYVQNNKIIYIGKSLLLKERVKQHKEDKLKNFIGDIYYFVCDSKTDMDMLEYVLINKYHPLYNEQYKNFNVKTDMQEPEWILYEEID